MNKLGFTAIEIVVVVAIVMILSVIVVPPFNNYTRKARDARRMKDFQHMTLALSVYRVERGIYPHQANGGNYIFSTASNFLSPLIPVYLQKAPKDPVNTYPAGWDWFNGKGLYYAYYHYDTPATQAQIYGCPDKTFAVLGIRKFESSVPANRRQKAYCGPTSPPFTCPPWGINGVCRDWSLEFDYSVRLEDF